MSDLRGEKSSQHLRVPAGHRPAADPHDVLFGRWCQAVDEVPPGTDIAFLGVPFDGAVAGRPGARGGPGAIRAALASRTVYDPLVDLDLSECLRVVDAGDVAVVPQDVVETHHRVEAAVTAIAGTGSLPIVVGGDHSISYATVRGVAAASGGPVGVLQFDAHHDLREPVDNTINSGTPFRRLLEDEPPMVRPGAFVQVGIAPWRNSRAYTDYAREHGIRVIGMPAVNARGMAAVMADCLDIVGQDQAGFFVSFDVDVLDVSLAPGVSAPTPGGMTAPQAYEAIRMAGAHPRCLGMDVVETAPNLDPSGHTAAVAAVLLLEFMAGVAMRGNAV